MAPIKPTKPGRTKKEAAKQPEAADDRDESRQTRWEGGNHNESRQTRGVTANHNESRQTRGWGGNNHNESRACR